jgi:predicted SprT family Zn-dependent metalloprotease
MMEVSDAKALARQLLNEFGYANVALVITNARGYLGMVDWSQDGHGRMKLSRPLIECNSAEQIEDTIRHEIAHLIAGGEAGHGPEWKAACRVTGAIPERIAHNAVCAPYKYTWDCNQCGKLVQGFYRRPRRRIWRFVCGRCGGKLTEHGPVN